MIEIKGVSKIIGVAKIKTDNKTTLSITMVYAPTADSDKTQCEEFYKELEDTKLKHSEYSYETINKYGKKMGEIRFQNKFNAKNEKLIEERGNMMKREKMSLELCELQKLVKKKMRHDIRNYEDKKSRQNNKRKWVNKENVERFKYGEKFNDKHSG